MPSLLPFATAIGSHRFGESSASFCPGVFPPARHSASVRRHPGRFAMAMQIGLARPAPRV